jgi:hypothetical protein
MKMSIFESAATRTARAPASNGQPVKNNVKVKGKQAQQQRRRWSLLDGWLARVRGVVRSGQYGGVK